MNMNINEYEQIKKKSITTRNVYQHITVTIFHERNNAIDKLDEIDIVSIHGSREIISVS